MDNKPASMEITLGVRNVISLTERLPFVCIHVLFMIMAKCIV